MRQDLLDSLLALKQRDVQMRARLLREGRLYNDYDQAMQDIHVQNALELDSIVERYGWPDIALVGLEGCRAAWLIAQHAICTPALQRKFLVLLSEAVQRGEVPEKQIAFLTDRIRFNEQRPQVYGTVLDWDENGELSCILEEPATVDARRQAVGLPPFAQDLARQRQAVAAEGGKPPADYARYRQAAREWARRVGWLN